MYQKRNEEKLRGILKKIAGNIEFSVDGGAAGGDKSQIDTAVRSLVRWVRKYVDYLPGKTPEAFIWDNMDKTEETL